MPKKPRRVWYLRGGVLWLVSAVIYGSGLLAERLLYSDSISCELARDTYIYGEAGWSWLPLGHTCSWTGVVNGVTIVDYPTMMASAPVLVLLLWGVSLLAAKRADDRRSEPSELPADSSEGG